MKKWRLAWSEDDSEVYTDKQGLRDGIKTVRAAWQGGDFKSPWVEVWFTEGYGWEAQERFSLAVPDVTEVLAELRDRAQGLRPSCPLRRPRLRVRPRSTACRARSRA